MPEHPSVTNVCPYLRGRHQTEPSLTPGDDNRCLLASSIYLPHAQQSRYCLGGHYKDCPRYQQQQNRPVPRYVRGASPPDVHPVAPTQPLNPLPWRHPWVAPIVKGLLIILLTALFIYLWRWRMLQTPPYVVKRDVVPTPMVVATPTISPLYLRPTVGPPPW